MLPQNATRHYAEVMAEALTIGSIPLVRGADGVMRIRGTRVTLDTVVAAFAEGATAEEIAQQYPSASLADIYQVIGYYLQHAGELDSYLSDRQKQISASKETNESKWSPDGVRDRLMSRRRTCCRS